MYLIIKSIIQCNLVAFNLHTLYFHKNQTNEIDIFTKRVLNSQVFFELIEMYHMFFIRKKKDISSISHHMIVIIIFSYVSKFGKNAHANILNLITLNQITGVFGFNLQYLLRNTKYENIQNTSTFLQCIFIRIPLLLVAMYKWNNLEYSNDKMKYVGNILGFFKAYNEYLWIKWSRKLIK